MLELLARAIAVRPLRWLDMEGASLIVTLRKAWGRGGPPRGSWDVAALIMICVQAPGAEDSAIQSCALAIAHLLPALTRCGPLFIPFAPVGSSLRVQPEDASRIKVLGDSR